MYNNLKFYEWIDKIINWFNIFSSKGILMLKFLMVIILFAGEQSVWGLNLKDVCVPLATDRKHAGYLNSCRCSTLCDPLGLLPTRLIENETPLLHRTPQCPWNFCATGLLYYFSKPQRLQWFGSRLYSFYPALTFWRLSQRYYISETIRCWAYKCIFVSCMLYISSAKHS